MNNKTKHAAAVAGALGLGVLLSACDYHQEPWVDNDEEWKRQAFSTQVDEDALQSRLARTQGDR